MSEVVKPPILTDQRGRTIWSDDLIRYVVHRSEAGETAATIAVELGLTATAVMVRLAKLRASGQCARSKRSQWAWSTAADKQLIKLLNEGLSHPKIAEQLGRTTSAVGKRAKHLREGGAPVARRTANVRKQLGVHRKPHAKRRAKRVAAAQSSVPGVAQAPDFPSLDGGQEVQLLVGVCRGYPWCEIARQTGASEEALKARFRELLPEPTMERQVALLKLLRAAEAAHA